MTRRRELIVSVHQRRSASGTVNRLTVRGPATIKAPGRMVVEYLHVDNHDLRVAPVLDGYVLVFIQHAMKLGVPLRVDGPVSESFMRNAYELQKAWVLHHPDRGRVMDIEPLDVIADHGVRLAVSGSGRAIAAFSGGLDATSLLLQHTQQMPAAYSYNLRDVVIVHGWDIDVRRRAEFDALLRRVRPLLDNLGVRAHVVRTSLRLVDAQPWLRVYGAQVASVLHQFADRFDHGLLAGAYSYTETDLPAGSSAATDHLMSGATMRVVHSGAAFSRVDKAAHVSRNPIALRSVRVCFEGPRLDRNCGECSKCVLTRLDFLAAGIEDPPCFDTPFTVDLVEGVSRFTYLYEQALREADARGVRDPRFDVVRRKLAERDAGLLPPDQPRPASAEHLRLLASRVARRGSPLRRRYRIR